MATRFFHSNALGSLGMATDWSGGYVEEMLYYPWGQGWTNDGWDARFASLPIYDYNTDLEMTWARLFANDQGRWMSPDPLAGDITNPQSLNRYAYVANNPTTLVDPRGAHFFAPCLGGDWSSCSISLLPPGGVASGVSFGLGGVGPRAESYANYVNQVTPLVQFTGSLYGHGYKGTFSSFDAYFAWRTGIAALPESQAYAQLLKANPYFSGGPLDPNATYTVRGQRRGLTSNYEVLDPNDPAVALFLSDSALNAAGTMAPGNEHGPYNLSYYLGGCIDVFHGVEVFVPTFQDQLPGGEFHSDAFSPVGPFVALHGIDWLASKILPNSSWGSFLCSINGGCTPKP